MRFVILATIARGRVHPPEPLDEQGQVAAFSTWHMDASRDVRVIWERSHVLRMLADEPEGAKLPVSGEMPRTVERMMRLAAKARTA